MFQWLKPVWKIISQHFSAEDFETSVNMIKENFKVFLQVISATIIGEKQILKILQDYFYLIIDYVSIKTHDSGSSIMLMALNMLFSNRGCNQVFNASIKDAMMCLNFLQFMSVVISKTPSRSCPWKLQKLLFSFSWAAQVWDSVVISFWSTEVVPKFCLLF